MLEDCLLFLAVERPKAIPEEILHDSQQSMLLVSLVIERKLIEHTASLYVGKSQCAFRVISGP